MNPDTCVPIWKVENGILEKVERGGIDYRYISIGIVTTLRQNPSSNFLPKRAA